MARRLLLAVPALVLCVPATAQVYGDNTADIPSGAPDNFSDTEQIDFADVDLDGDWDAAFADGGDSFNDQNRLWINQGGAQLGQRGVFLDETVARFPTINDMSRDIEFADIDSDGDPDLFVSNTSSIVNQPSRWWVNQGGVQGGSIGFYQDDPSRWVGIGAPGSSIASALVMPGGFINWSSDSDFADLDNDGDLDLIHSAYGGAFGGQVPTRLFLNDGDGFFSEFNPSGFQLGGANIQTGDPGIWCDGTQLSNTTNTNGMTCDVAAATVDLDVGDIDADFDLDVLLGDRQDVPRMFANRLEASGLAPDAGGLLRFRDVTNLSFPPNHAVGGGNFEQELGDIDGDDDLDVYGLDWGVIYSDVTLDNDGAGFFAAPVPVPNTGFDAEEVDYVDFDNDGDLDVFLANFSGQDGLLENTNGSFASVPNGLPSSTGIGRDGEVADVDGDGDFDIFVANGASIQANKYLENLTGVADTTAPRLPLLEQAPNRFSSAEPSVVRVHVYDNVGYYTLVGTGAWLVVSVDFGTPFEVPMTWSGGQVFRGEIPGAVVGQVSYRAFARDQSGNLGSSVTRSYVSASSGLIGSYYCGSVPNSTGAAATLAAHGSTTAADNALYIVANDLPTSQFGYFLAGQTQGFVPNPGGSQGNLCLAGVIGRHVQQIGDSGAAGKIAIVVDLTSIPTTPVHAVVAGETWNWQAWYRDVNPNPTSNFSDGVSIAFQ